MRNVKWLALLLALCLLLTSGCALIEKDANVDRATTVATYNGNTLTKGEVLDMTEYYLSYYSSLYAMYGMRFDATDPEVIVDIRGSVIDSWIADQVDLKIAADKGMDTLTAEEQAELDEQIATGWADVHDQVQSSFFADTELEGDALEAAITEQMTALGYTYDDYCAQQKNSYVRTKLQNSVKNTVTVTDAELQAELDTRAENAKTNYETNPGAYGTAVTNGTAVYYRPAGYRNIMNLLLQFKAEDKAVIDEVTGRKTTAEAAATAATTALTDLGVENVDELLAQVTVTASAPVVEAAPAAEGAEGTETVEAVETAKELPNVVAVTEVTENKMDVAADVAEQVIALATANAEAAFYAEQVSICTEMAYANIDPKADAVLARLDAGEDFKAVMAETTEDPGMQPGAQFAETGYPVSEASTNWDPAFRDAAMALANVGDHSGKVRGSYGYYIVYYASDVAEGPVALDEVRAAIEPTVLSNKQDAAWADQEAAWVSEAKVKVDTKCFED